MLNYQRVCELRGSNLFDLKLQLHNLARAALPCLPQPGDILSHKREMKASLW